MANIEIFSETGRELATNILSLWDKIPLEKRYYLLGYMQSEADKTLAQKSGEHGC